MKMHPQDEGTSEDVAGGVVKAEEIRGITHLQHNNQLQYNNQL